MQTPPSETTARRSPRAVVPKEKVEGEVEPEVPEAVVEEKEPEPDNVRLRALTKHLPTSLSLLHARSHAPRLHPRRR